MTRKKYRKILEGCPPELLAHIDHIWGLYARDNQTPPDDDWLIWLLLGGRGSGKTRTGAEWIREQVFCGGARRIALIAPTYNDAREVMLEGESGLLRLGYPSERPTYRSSRRRLEWPNGAIGQVFSAEEPDGLRGPQFDCAWADEFCAWSYPEDTLSNLRLALRLGQRPRLVMTTTPKPLPALKALLKNPIVRISHMTTSDNQNHLAASFIETMEAEYGGTRLGRQELGGEMLTDAPGALWNYVMMDAAYIDTPPTLDKIIVAIDPPVTSGARADSCGLIVAGLSGHGAAARAIILHDGTTQGQSPQGWAQRAVDLYQEWGANYLLAEVNQGGEMVSTILRSVDDRVPVRNVRASVGKTARAEPVAALYEQGKVRHAGRFKALEDELCLMGSALMGRKSPDRADALVWAVTELMLKGRGGARIRWI
ncbi:MAG: terminase family protein [Robiginitomaculum sp.]